MFLFYLHFTFVQIKERVQHSSIIKESIVNHNLQKNKNALSIKQGFRDQTAKYNQIKKEMNERITNRPLLVETRKFINIYTEN